MKAPHVLGLLLVAYAGLLTGCERPLVAPHRPLLELRAPDLSFVQEQPAIELAVAASSPRGITAVTVNGDALHYDPDGNRWTRTVFLRGGLNTLLLAATDGDGLTEVDTVYAVHLIHQTAFQQAPGLPSPRGGHAATLLADGSLLVTGGALGEALDARPEAFLLPADGDVFIALSTGLTFPRAGHTATLLPDGRMLLLGGAVRNDPTGSHEFWEVAEVYDPATRTFTVLPIEGRTPIRRAFHTASVRVAADGAFLIDVYGGRGVIGGAVQVLRDLRTFALRGDVLTSLSPSPGPLLPTALVGHTQVPLGTPPTFAAARHLIAGSTFADGAVDNVAFTLDYTGAAGLTLAEVAPLHTPRIHHAATLLAPGHVFVTGGHQGNTASALYAPELYVAGADRFFRFPPHLGPLKRFGLTATKLRDGRILLIGGFSPSGNAVSVSEFFEAARF